MKKNNTLRMERYKLNRRIVICMIILISSLFIMSFMNLTQTVVNAKGSVDRVKLVKSLEIQKGDTLWSIASEYITDDYKSINDYIEEIKLSNGMTSDKIRAGNYIILPYYVEVDGKEN